MRGPLPYEIQVMGQLDERWSSWFNGMQVVVQENGISLIYGQLADQAALHGVLTKIRDLNLTLLSVRLIFQVPGSHSA
ncbi:MAG: hypothetical protein JSV61_12980 [Anaerolineales bacterium]|nr:MAG: hypothetical protein JSV61_12980 [Anaerolineales bacterium]